ncbi:NIPSNAP family protein [Burkholderia pseudomultivorans]|uniref:NIPSNAP family containing protein n=3 Tax=Burkholderia cepacia complex TaxID=87882 RepID=A0A132F5P1_9BURK|nr:MULTISPECIES: NIPSNAP family protein [Burkholderia cepacia complex]AIO30160.1 NIPSNAP family protein [Burkholderia cenocepacia]EGC98748.1 NIPSNAP family protein [Burkholderia sp. TJI49]AOI90638.1 NIPSNAP family containing protein [Burkholderia pseudomultivorans]KVC25071.1 NIPSNAP family containing protein [Burkholderia pseudomultivorans]KVC34890.1 NIPSNAP family containing protein [Burkholderia pseudomultivorans]
MPDSKAFIDHRIYTIRPRGMAEFLEIFDRLAMPIQVRYLGPPVGFYMSDIGALNQVVHLWGYDSIADYDARRTARDADPEWPAYLQASGHLIVAQESRIVRRVDFPSLAYLTR